MIWTVPNLLTFARLAAAPGLMVAFGLFLAAAATDWLDGWIARAWEQRSPLGAALDPVADKAMVITALMLLVGLHGAQAWLAIPAAVIVLREMTVSGLREHLGGARLAVTPLAKWKTAAQMVAVALLLVALQAGLPGDRPLEGPPPGIWEGVRETPLLAIPAIAALWLAAVLTAVTGWDYLTRAIAYMRGMERENA